MRVWIVFTCFCGHRFYLKQKPARQNRLLRGTQNNYLVGAGLKDIANLTPGNNFFLQLFKLGYHLGF